MAPRFIAKIPRSRRSVRPPLPLGRRSYRHLHRTPKRVSGSHLRDSRNKTRDAASRAKLGTTHRPPPDFKSSQHQTMNPNKPSRSATAIGNLIFLSRWLQAPLYLGLIVAQGVYVYHFFLELWHLVSGAPSLDEKTIMLTVLGLIDVVMIANLL